MAAADGPAAAPAARRRAPLALDSDRDFAGFVGRMIQGSARERFSDDQLDLASTRAAHRRVHLALRECRNEKDGLDITCWCREACGDEYRGLAACMRDAPAEPADRPRCGPECEALSRCVRGEWRQLLLAISPGPGPEDARERRLGDL
ncbi:unnamed protein product [Prorocentrum cordatum]|uniref:COX assembly mitochondrial protein n=1 Tax=Prorocentrum cordatum TaxID=2364126 RepID=A0ABN9QQ09_9DINO|nr:unnamed protein product [Polarella glacialis]